MQYEKAYAELIVFGGDVIVTSPRVYLRSRLICAKWRK